jgi:hypothetical protein
MSERCLPLVMYIKVIRSVSFMAAPSRRLRGWAGCIVR